MTGAALAVLSALAIAFAAFSRRLGAFWVSPAMFFVAGGLVTGSVGLGWLRVNAENQTVRALAEATLTLLLFADASRIDLGRLRRGLGLPVRLLGIGLPLTIAAGTLAGLSALPGLTVAEALILAIVLAPTDAALGQAVVTDRRLPARIRQALNVESGLNDGICVPLLFIALAAAEAEDRLVSGSQAVHIVFQEIGGGLAGGVVAGLAGAFAVRLAVTRGLGEGSWIQVIPAATALLAYGLSAIPGGSGFIAAFVAGLVFGGLEKTGARQVTSLVDDAGEFLDAITLALFGAVLLGPLLGELSWRSLLYAALSLTLVRMAPVAL
ncbi:MAG: cation:proton antiporter, partial [Actinobacteria bacterium]|nr:cation:proton antiporter [Actinomycetota bacterium]